MAIYYGIEEEVFLIDEERPAIDSLYPLFSLVKKNPAFYYLHTAVNLARGKDVLNFFVASVEISTGICSSPEEAIESLRVIRKEFSQSCPQKIACVGMLPQYADNPSLVAGLHLHLSGDFDLEEARLKIAYYLPALLLLTANSPSLTNPYLSNRILKNPFAGTIVMNGYERFQDVIISRRLQTLEVRIFDPCPDLERYKLLLDYISRIVVSPGSKNLNLKEYALLREEACKHGVNSKKVKELVAEFCEEFDADFGLFATPPALKTSIIFKEKGLKEAFEILDGDYREGVIYSGANLPKTLRAAIGFLGYYLPKMPYTTYKFLKEHGYL